MFDTRIGDSRLGEGPPRSRSEGSIRRVLSLAVDTVSGATAGGGGDDCIPASSTENDQNEQANA